MDYRKKPQQSVQHKNQLIGTMEIVLAFSLAGSSLIVAKMLSFRVPVFLTGTLSLVVAFACMVPFQFKKLEELKKLKSRELFLMLLQALFGIVLFRVLTLYGLQRTTSADAAIITASTPAVMALFSVIMLKEKIGINSLMGVLLALLALGLVNLGNIGLTSGNGTLVGNFLIFLAVVSEVLLTIFRKYSKVGISSITNTTILTLIAIILMTPFALVELRTFSVSQMNSTDWIAISYYGAIATAAAYILWGDGALKIPASYTGVACVSMPISALLLSHFVLGESLTGYHIMGCSLAILGIVVCNLNLAASLKNKEITHPTKKFQHG